MDGPRNLNSGLYCNSKENRHVLVLQRKHEGRQKVGSFKLVCEVRPVKVLGVSLLSFNQFVLPKQYVYVSGEGI